MPAVQAVKRKGIRVYGPFPADSLFYHAVRGDYDAVVCMYHDQGLIPLKLHHFFGGVALTLGPPFIRTSVDHGTAYDIAGKGKADASSMKEAILLAARLARARYEAENEMNPAIFREYDIRGLAEQDFDEKFALLLGKVHGTMIAERGGKRVTVGRDCRATSDPYAEAVIAGLASTGLQVYDIGICPTPLLYFSLFHLNVDGGIEVTASHNPSEYNGFKLCIGKDTLYGQQIQDVRVKMDRNEFQEKAGGKVSATKSYHPIKSICCRMCQN